MAKKAPRFKVGDEVFFVQWPDVYEIKKGRIDEVGCGFYNIRRSAGVCQINKHDGLIAPASPEGRIELYEKRIERYTARISDSKRMLETERGIHERYVSDLSKGIENASRRIEVWQKRAKEEKAVKARK